MLGTESKEGGHGTLGRVRPRAGAFDVEKSVVGTKVPVGRRRVIQPRQLVFPDGRNGSELRPLAEPVARGVTPIDLSECVAAKRKRLGRSELEDTNGALCHGRRHRGKREIQLEREIFPLPQEAAIGAAPDQSAERTIKPMFLRGSLRSRRIGRLTVEKTALERKERPGKVSLNRRSRALRPGQRQSIAIEELEAARSTRAAQIRRWTDDPVDFVRDQESSFPNLGRNLSRRHTQGMTSRGGKVS